MIVFPCIVLISLSGPLTFTSSKTTIDPGAQRAIKALIGFKLLLVMNPFSVFLKFVPVKYTVALTILKCTSYTKFLTLPGTTPWS